VTRTRTVFFALLVSATLTACGGAAGRAGATLSPAEPPVPAYVPGVVPDSFVVRLATTKGDIDLMIRHHWAPLGAAQMYEAVSTGYYDGARFFRTLRGFVAQFGLAADPEVTASWRGRRIADDPVTESNRRGTVVYASAGPGTRTTQLFLNLRDNARLDAMGFPPIGEVVAGHDAMDALYAGYGDGATGPAQDRITREGEAYLAAEFPLLDKIERARVIRAWFAPVAQ
jgi:peptidyl-prolyl cis-trans isomerase A (cyclophilin A)